MQKQFKVSKAYLEYATGKKFFEDALKDANYDIYKVDDAMDALNRALKLATKDDMELEAITEAYLGKIHLKAYQNRKKARMHLQQCFVLTFAQHPKVFNDKLWYKLA